MHIDHNRAVCARLPAVISCFSFLFMAGLNVKKLCQANSFFSSFFWKHKSEKKIQMPRFVVRPIFRVCFPSAV